MARSKEQWNAQQRALHNQDKSKSSFYHDDVKQSGLTSSGSRAVGPFVSSKLFPMDRFNSGTPSPASPATAVANLRAFKFSRAPKSEHLNDCQSNQVIDLTMDDEDSDKDETLEDPIGVKRVAPAADVAPAHALSPEVSNSTNNEAAAVKMQLKHYGEMTSETKMPLTEDIESDVDEEWPLVPAAPVSSMTSKESLPMDHQAAYNRMEEDVGATLDAIYKTVPLFQGESGEGNSEQNDRADMRWQHKSTLHLYDDKGSSTTDTDVGEGLSHNALEENEDAARVVTTSDSIDVSENLEDGEIFEEGGPPVSVLPIKIVESTPSVHAGTASVDAMGINMHPRHKKQKKRGKKKAKRKLETMQTLHASPCETSTVFKRTIRQRPYVSASLSDQHRHGTIRNGTRGETVDVCPVFQDPPPAFFHVSGPHAGGPRAGILHPPSSQQHQLAPPPVLQYGDSQILRVNRQGSVKMLEGGAGLPVCPTFSEPLMQVGALPRTYLEPPMQVGALLSLHPTFSDRPIQGGAGMSLPRMFSEPPMQGGFQYRSMPASSSLPVSNRQGFPLKHFQSTSFRPPPVSAPRHNVAVSKKRDESDDFNLDSLRVAALRSKTKHGVKTTESTDQKVTVAQSSPPLLRSPSILAENGKGRENPKSPEIDELRLEILQSMKRKQHRTVNDAKPKKVSPISEPVAMETSDENGLSEVAKTNPLASCIYQDTTKKLSELKVPDVTIDTDHIEAERPTSEMNKPAVRDEQKQVEDSTAFCVTASSKPAQPQAGLTVSSPEFRPLTASSQSLVIRLSPDDFSPQARGGDGDTKAPASSSLQNAIQEMRRKIAEREKEKTNRLSLSAATRLSQQSFDTLSSLALSPTSLLPSSQDNQVLAEFVQLANDTKLSTDVSASPAESTKVLPAGVIVDGLENNIGGQNEAGAVKETVSSPPEADLSAETMEVAAGQDSQLKPALASEALRDTLGGVATLTIADDVEGRITCSSIATDKSVPHSATLADSELDFDAVRVEYEQCVNEYEEAEMHIARLSHEMAQLEKRLSQFRSIVEEGSGR